MGHGGARERRRTSPHAVVGFYWFAGLELFATAVESYCADRGRLEQGERCIAPVDNQLIAGGHEVRIGVLPADAVHPLGTPAEVQALATRPAA